MGETEGPTRCQDQRPKRWHDKRMRKKGCNLGDKKLMNSSNCEASRIRKTSNKKGRTITNHLPFVTWCNYALMTKVTF